MNDSERLDRPTELRCFTNWTSALRRVFCFVLFFFLKRSPCKIFVWLSSETFLLAAPSRTTFLFLQWNFKRGEGRPVKTGHLNSVFFFFFLNRKQITKVNNWMLQFLSFLLPRNVKSCHTHRESEIKTEERVGEMSGRKRCPHMTAQVSVQRWVENNTSVQLSH